MKRFHTLAVFAVSLIAMPAAAQVTNLALTPSQMAQIQGQGAPGVINQYDDKYKPVAAFSGGKAGDVMAQGRYMIGLTRHPRDEDRYVSLRVTAPSFMQGCAAAQFGSVTQTYRGRTLDVKMGSPTVTIDRRVKAPHYQCNTRGSQAAIIIPLEMQALEDKRAEYLMLRVGNAVARYSVNIRDDLFSIKPIKAGTFVPENGAQSLVHIFYPPHTVALSVPSLKPSGVTMGALRDIAEDKGMTPLPLQPHSPQVLLASSDESMMTGIIDRIDQEAYYLGRYGAYSITQAHDVIAQRP